jgi:predicted enzyme related to lactoylglutathione lyase
MNAVNWFEIPARDLDRATRFYNRVLDTQLRKEMFETRPMAIFPSSETGVGGALVQDRDEVPSLQGTLIYLNARDESGLVAALGRVEGAGGRVLMPKTAIGPQGFIAVIEDTEHNRVGVHAPPA